MKTDGNGVATVCGATVIPAKSTLRVRFKTRVITTRRISKIVTLSGCSKNEVTQSPTPGTTPTTSPPTTTIPALAAPTSLQLKASSDTGVSSSDGITKATVLAFTGSAPAGSSVQLSVNNLVTGSPCITDVNGLFECSITGVSEGTRSITAIATLDGRTSSSSVPLTVVVDRTGPTMTITPERSTVGSNATYDIVFTANESVSGFTLSDIDVWCVICAALSFSGSGATYSMSMEMSGINTDIDFLIDIATYTDLAGNFSLCCARAQIQYDMYGPQATLSWLGANTYRLIFNETPYGLEKTDFKVRPQHLSNDCAEWTPGLPYAAGVGLSDLRPVSGSTTEFDFDVIGVDLEEPPTFYTLEIAGAYADEWNNVSSGLPDQPEMWLSRWWCVL